VHSDVLVEKDFAYAAKGPQKIPQAGPKAFRGMDRHFPHAIPVQVFGPHASPRGMANGALGAARIGYAIVSLPLIRVARGLRGTEVFDVRLQIGDGVGAAHFQPGLAGFAPEGAGHWRAVVIPRAVAADFVAAPPRRIGGIGVAHAFFPRVLVPLVHLPHRVGQGLRRTPRVGVGLQAGPQFQQMGIAGTQFLGQVGRTLALGNALHNHHDLRTGPLSALPERAGKGVVDAPADTPVIPHWSAISPVNAGLRHRSLTTTTAQTLRVQNIDQPGIAFLFVHQVHGRKSRHGSAARYSGEYRQTGPMALHTVGNMSHIIYATDTVMGVNPEDGNIIWNYPWCVGKKDSVLSPIFLKEEWGKSTAVRLIGGVSAIATEQYYDNYIFVSSVSNGCALFLLNGNNVSQRWFNKNMQANYISSIFNNSHLYGDNHLYGITDVGDLVCLCPTTPKEKWRKRNFGRGNVIAVDNVLIALTENEGDLVMIQLDSNNFNELGRLRPLGGKSMNGPIIDGSKLIIRNEQAMVCLELKPSEK
jgi:hypothetical protein